MPNDKYNSIKRDADHVDNHPEKRSENPYKNVFTKSSYDARPSDLGSGMARKAADAISPAARRRKIEEALGE